MHIRPATFNDAAGIGRINVLAWRHAYRKTFPHTALARLSVLEHAKRWRRTLITELLRVSTTWVLEDHDRILGYAQVGPTRDRDLDPRVTAELFAIYLHPSVWGQGHGTRLLNTAVEHLHIWGFQDVMLWVLADNIAARRFYLARGFRDDGTRKRERVLNTLVLEHRLRRPHLHESSALA